MRFRFIERHIQQFRLPVPAGHSAAAYLFEGAGSFGGDGEDQGELVEGVSMVVFGEGDRVQVESEADSPARFMLIAEAPFKEFIVPYGPFVMNTQEEIMQALADLRNGTFVENQP